MNQFYVSIIFMGITLIAVSLVWIAYDKKRSHDYLSQIDAKKEELVGIINDAEQMIEEMNKFSDYIVTQMELKNQEMCSSIRILEEKVKKASDTAQEVPEYKVINNRSERAVNGGTIDIRLDPDISVLNSNQVSDLIIDNIKLDTESFNNYSTKPNRKVRDKVIPLNSKHKEVIQLAHTGLNDTEIAKSLRMGKGEVQLILGMNR